MRRAVGARRSEEDEREARRRVMQSAKKTAEAMLKTLGEMKGLPLKLGQMASYIDGLAPPGYEERFQRVLARLQQKAPPLSPDAAPPPSPMLLPADLPGAGRGLRPQSSPQLRLGDLVQRRARALDDDPDLGGDFEPG